MMISLDANIFIYANTSGEKIKNKKKRERREVSSPSNSDYFLRPVRRAAMLPTFLPGGACLLTVVGLPGD